MWSRTTNSGRAADSRSRRAETDSRISEQSIRQLVVRTSQKVPEYQPTAASSDPPLSCAAVDRLTNALLAARDGDDTALGDAIRAGQVEVVRFLRPLVDDCDLDDVVQDTFVRVYAALPRFRGDSTGRTWLLAIARHAAADAIRSKRRFRRSDHHPTLPAYDGSMESTHALHGLIDNLHADRREAFVLTQLVGCSYAEAAEVCGVKIGTIRSRVARARDELLHQVHAARSA
ncbi:MAG: sigma-70 family RNA polymerase sigma factor [Acidimicrobiia bacterium]|nr:sigma-70 family RNA polymerase sigma factor [Acidimicrobiia bacterium]